ncbi:HPr kinase/phosphorylase [Labrys wisconsinensis]|uniref:Serine kinase of HPr protein (Carbohydrate metabolism regulator) n=1 Tax=Labrys wisconsinensis TaxID=425677 RepID=A0ABU0IZ77_9HYPH|nr:HPr kinase/phosphatase C-terminal domain-containing protein [Labrys wisconsinensis]MDQ0467318.1 serine kinase of HPr protein (carbohydrate metabolism regulator) [Labrys wisconsinensis]
MSGPSIHATCLLVGAKGVLIRGAPGAGKSRLALALIDDAARRGRFARLVGDDRVVLEAAGGRLVARAPAGIAGLIERRGLGIERVAFEPAAVLALVADIVADDALERLPEEASRRTVLAGIALARLAVPGDPARAVPLVEAALAALPER